ncbi:SET domain-containing protein-lysine N-methyltransferase [Sorangium sp. So ce119]|uniref:SET domain-containing protein-lysine N-methyltransferase n=1 Tax=Sorangium sp. So ce119 TaxID=3133279 RepID=UPI003F6417D1
MTAASRSDLAAAPALPPADPASQGSASIAQDPHFEVTAPDRFGQRCVRSLAAFAAGDVLQPFGAAVVHDRPDRMTLQLSQHQHIDLEPGFLAFINHSCDPNAYFDVELRALVALRPIAPGDEIAFFYPSTEWAMSSPFECRCGSARCLRRIAGASELPPAVLAEYRLAPHIARQLAQGAPPSSGAV